MHSIKLSILLISIVILSNCATAPPRVDTRPPTGSSIAVVNDISPAAASSKTAAAYSQFVDVRTAEEYTAGHPERAINIPLEKLEQNLGRLEKNEPVYVICETGRRSKEGADLLAANGFKWVFNVSGGTAAWREAGLPTETVLR